jgi:serine O-acetyltransferase
VKRKDMLVTSKEKIVKSKNLYKGIGLSKILHETWVVHQRDWTFPGFRAVAVYHLGKCWMGIENRWLRAPLVRIYRFFYRYIRNHYGIELQHTATVGRRLWIAHQHGIVIHPYAKIGNDCIIRHNVTIGAINLDRWEEGPELEDEVEIGAGVVVIGPVKVGKGARIGPNAVVTKDIPPGVSVFGNPSRIIR